MSVHHVSSPTHTLLLHALRVKQAYKRSLTAQEGHKVTLLTRGKKPVTFQIPDDTDSSYKEFQSAVQHIACDRTDTSAIQEKLGGKNFDGACYVLTVLPADLMAASVVSMAAIVTYISIQCHLQSSLDTK